MFMETKKSLTYLLLCFMLCSSNVFEEQPIRYKLRLEPNNLALMPFPRQEAKKVPKSTVFHESSSSLLLKNKNLLLLLLF